MKLLVLGATGGTGRLIVHQALARGHDVTALVRNPDRAAALGGARLVVGNALDRATVAKAVHGQDAVVSALGTPASPVREVDAQAPDAAQGLSDKDRQEALIRDSGLDWTIVRPAVLNDKPHAAASGP